MLALRKEFEEQQAQLVKYEALASVLDSANKSSSSPGASTTKSRSEEDASEAGRKTGADMSRTTSTAASSSFGDALSSSRSTGLEEEDADENDGQQAVEMSGDNSSGELVDAVADELDKVANPR